MAVRNFLIKPVSGLCNMRCRYCFYEDESEHRAQKSLGVMSQEVADRLIERAFDGLTRRDAVTFGFQGGEPTLAGLSYFRHFVERVEGANTQCVPVQYTIQTNALELDDAWTALFRDHRFLVGVSVDGDKALHDENRLDAAGKGTWNRVSRSVERLLRAGVEVNLLCVVTRRCARSPQKVYQALKKLGAEYLQFIACLDPLEEPRGQEPWSLLPEDYGRFLCGLFDLWYRDWETGHYTSVRLFDDFVHRAMGLPASTCATNGSCGAYYVVEGDGSVYPCDFYALDPWRMGSICTDSLEALAASPQAVQFLEEGCKRSETCTACRWFSLCGGGCRRDWARTEEGGAHNYYCRSFQMLFEHAAPRLAEIARAERLAGMGR